MEQDGELIFFKIPTEETTLFVESLHPDTTHEELEEAFQPFGLLYEIKQFQMENRGAMSLSITTHYHLDFAFVKYYSKRSATEAQKQMDKHVFHGKPCKVRFSKSQKNQIKDFYLDINRAIELANYYIGFNEWFTSILSLNQDVLEMDESTMHFSCTYTCRIGFSLRDGRTLEAIGTANYSGSDRSHVIEYAKKNAVTAAKKNAFEQIVLVLFNGKVAVHFLKEGLKQWESNTNTISQSMLF